jgi:tRNA pseudouridine38-40 synthase
MRIALTIEYDGSRYHGWQAQANLITIQGMIETALSKVADMPIQVICAGRTDTGVHATHQVIHFDCDKERHIRSFIQGSNTFLPKDITVRWGKEVTSDFHARYTATSRRYRYIIYNHPIRPALFRSTVTWQYRALNEKLMNDAAQCLIGENDFTSFRSSECQSNTPMRKLTELTIFRKGDLIIIDIEANAFLHHMVRNIVGVLVQVGSMRMPVEWVESVLQAKDRKLGAETAPAYGLYLVGVTYPTEFEIPHLGQPPFIF